MNFEQVIWECFRDAVAVTVRKTGLKTTEPGWEELGVWADWGCACWSLVSLPSRSTWVLCSDPCLEDSSCFWLILKVEEFETRHLFNKVYVTEEKEIELLWV